MPTPEPSATAERHPQTFEPWLLAVLILTSVAGAVIGLQIITTLGVTPNTSIIGVLLAILISRIPLAAFLRFRSVHRQNLVQTSISTATFAAANSLLLTIGIPAALGRQDLLVPMLIGASMAMVIDLMMLYWLFDTRIFPASGAWPPGIASAEAIIAGDKGGRRARVLGYGALIGVGGAALGVPMSAFGVAFIGNIWALSMFGAGLLLAGYSGPLFGTVMAESYVPHGMMIGAGLVALVQAIVLVVRHRMRRPAASGSSRGEAAAPPADPAPAGGGAGSADGAAEHGFTRDDSEALRGLGKGAVLYVLAGIVLALAGGLYTGMGPVQLLLWALFAALACIAAEFIVGLSAMHAGWFPAFATALVFLVLGMFFGFPTPAVVLLSGFVAAGSPAFADGGYDFKAGWILRGRGGDPAQELEGRRQQLLAGLVGCAVAIAVVALTHNLYFDNGLFAPSSKVFATTIEAGLDAGAISEIALWAIPGALIQLVAGSRRQMGIMLATGLIVADPIAGWAVLAGLLIRIAVLRIRGPEAESTLAIIGGGVIAGDAIYGFFSSVVKAR
ncbi:putative oligopeptide transporter (OPT) family protein [Murinocardiopsis flavida]|uniref:Putative oligopeptide transporter (OPT) family protein n=1 Tax=Murinocardiopsis flavida TaxID=645275 RepID=A0A2P8DTP7_9ACTN|nr:OPT/YSL family transporter [Murinocardiopsis flavida]PSL00596.1 putative oligopeptide transporter (OPT) family protein [Murinocardiopsis flavida]